MNKTENDQAKKFAEAARKAGASDDPEAFDRILKKLESAPPPESVRKRKKPKD